MILNKKLLMIMSIVLAGVLLLAGCGGSSSNSADGGNQSETGGSDVSNDTGSKDVIEMNVSNFNPSTHHYAYNVYEPWAKLVEEKSGGRIKVNLYHGGTLGKSKTVPQDVAGGIADVGLVVTTYFYDTKYFPYTIGNLPYAFPDSEVASKVMTKFGEKYAMDAFEDVHYLGNVTTTDPYDLFSTKPIKKVEDLKGLKMRVQGKNDADLIKDWGAVPVSLPLEDVYEALQKGTLDTAFYTPIGAVGNKYFEVGPYITKMGITVTPLIPIMNKDFYNKLPDDLKKLFDEELGPKLADLFTESYTKELEKAYQDLEQGVKGKGEVITLTDDELNGFKVPAKRQWDSWVKEADQKGYPGEQMMDDFKKMLQEEGVSLPF
jgi:TRAP-type C4-dicarboxylate transport system substrate-binding protein